MGFKLIKVRLELSTLMISVFLGLFQCSLNGIVVATRKQGHCLTIGSM